jgi:hypothetical protein
METLHEFLARREQELVADIGKLREALAPLEGELADVRRARGAVFHGLPSDEDGPLRKAISASDEFEPVPEAAGAFRRLTMKQLTEKALRENFPNGATAIKLVEFFHEAWGRKDIVRSSLSPQLSRLKAEHKVDLHGKVWKIKESEKGPEKSEPSSDVGAVAERSNAPDSKSGGPSSSKNTMGPVGSNPTGSAPVFTAQERSFRRDLLSTTQLHFSSRETS